MNIPVPVIVFVLVLIAFLPLFAKWLRACIRASRLTEIREIVEEWNTTINSLEFQGDDVRLELHACTIAIADFHTTACIGKGVINERDFKAFREVVLETKDALVGYTRCPLAHRDSATLHEFLLIQGKRCKALNISLITRKEAPYKRALNA